MSKGRRKAARTVNIRLAPSEAELLERCVGHVRGMYERTGQERVANRREAILMALLLLDSRYQEGKRCEQCKGTGQVDGLPGDLSTAQRMCLACGGYGVKQ